MTETHTDLVFEANRGQAQFAYFQLGLAASAIAFAVHETEGRSLADTPWPIGLAVILWALSFAIGCFGITARHRGLNTNARYLVATRGIANLDSASHPDLRQAVEQAKQITQNDIDRPFRRFKWQLWFLFFGALAYISGHIVEMAHTPSRAQPFETHAGKPQPSR